LKAELDCVQGYHSASLVTIFKPGPYFEIPLHIRDGSLLLHPADTAMVPAYPPVHMLEHMLAVRACPACLSPPFCCCGIAALRKSALKGMSRQLRQAVLEK
jgi:hypothetical protein